MAGSSMTFAYDDGVPDAFNLMPGIRRLVCDFVTDDSAGTASGVTKKICGEVVKVVTDPGAAAPTANWDIVVTDENGLSPFAKCQNAARLLARHTTSTEEDYLYILNADSTPIGVSLYPVVCGELTVAVANGGNSKTGRIVLYIRPR